MGNHIENEMFRRIANGLNDLHHELLGEGIDVQFVVDVTDAGVNVSYVTVTHATSGSEKVDATIGVGGVVDPGSFVAIGDDGPETIELSAGFKDTGVVPTLPAKKTKGG